MLVVAVGIVLGRAVAWADSPQEPHYKVDKGWDPAGQPACEGGTGSDPVEVAGTGVPVVEGPGSCRWGRVPAGLAAVEGRAVEGAHPSGGRGVVEGGLAAAVGKGVVNCSENTGCLGRAGVQIQKDPVEVVQGIRSPFVAVVEGNVHLPWLTVAPLGHYPAAAAAAAAVVADCTVAVETSAVATEVVPDPRVGWQC